MDVLFDLPSIPVYQLKKKTKQDLLILELRSRLFCINWFFCFFSLFSSLPLLDIIFPAVLGQEGAVIVLENRKPTPKRKLRTTVQMGTSQQAVGSET